VLVIEPMYDRVLMVLLGLLLLELGIWEVTRALFPSQRVYRPLRKETDYFLSLVRRLNSAAMREGSIGAQQEMDRLHEELHHSVDRMHRLAGLTEDDLGYRYTAGGAPTGHTEFAAR
jgi:hypothetical protein